MSITTAAVANVVNYLVPAAGQTHVVEAVGAPFTNQPYLIDWRQFRLDNFPFQPQGVIADNSAGTTPVTITILPINYPINIPAGAIMQLPFPAPNGQTATVTGGGINGDVCRLYFVDYPVLPFYLPAAGAGGPQDVNIANVTSANPLLTMGSQLAQGNVPYRTSELVQSAQPIQGTIIAAASSVNLVPGLANQNLRKLIITLSQDAAIAADGPQVLTVASAGITFYTENMKMYAAPAGLLPYRIELDYSAIGLNCGAGPLTVTLSQALTAGVLTANAYIVAP